jgi:hypothetical protein
MVWRHPFGIDAETEVRGLAVQRVARDCLVASFGVLADLTRLPPQLYSISPRAMRLVLSSGTVKPSTGNDVGCPLRFVGVPGDASKSRKDTYCGSS